MVPRRVGRRLRYVRAPCRGHVCPKIGNSSAPSPRTRINARPDHWSRRSEREARIAGSDTIGQDGTAETPGLIARTEYFLHAPLAQAFREHRRGRRVSIGHDVWIGHGAVIMPGVSIGNGAVIGANAVVTRDVDPYTVVAGVPARVLRRRFDEGLAAEIEALGWWDWGATKLEAAVLDMGRLSPAEFVARWKDADRCA